MPINVNGNIVSSSDITSAGIFKTKVNRDGLICFLDAANKDSYSGSGTIWYDLSGSGANATLVNGVTFNSGEAGGVLVLNGSNQYITVPCGNLSSTNYTVMAGARYNTVGGRIISAESNNWLLGWWSSSTENYYAEGWVSPVQNGPQNTAWKIMNHPPYDTGKVKIGLTYTPPPPESTPESDWIQGVLLGDKQGMDDLLLTTIQSIGLIAFIVIVMLLTGGTSNA